jgi:hypothetical protein
MTTAIDCSRMSHTSCYGLDSDAAEAEGTPPGAGQGRDVGDGVQGASYECVNDCVSSLGVTTLVSGATAALGCALVPPACGLFVASGASMIVGACAAACEDLEALP